MTVLRNFFIIDHEVSGNTMYGSADICRVEDNGGFRNDMAHTVTDENLRGNAGILGFLVCQVNKCSGDSVSHLIRVGRVDFFKHLFFLLFGY